MEETWQVALAGNARATRLGTGGKNTSESADGRNGSDGLCAGSLSRIRARDVCLLEPEEVGDCYGRERRNDCGTSSGILCFDFDELENGEGRGWDCWENAWPRYTVHATWCGTKASNSARDFIAAVQD